jgi:hypothetical protein
MFTLDGARRLSTQPAGSAGVTVRFVEQSPLEAWQTDLSGFVASLASSKGVPSSGGEHLATMAVMESAYLSARTGQPEEPARFYQLHELAMPAAAPASGGPGQGGRGGG